MTDRFVIMKIPLLLLVPLFFFIANFPLTTHKTPQNSFTREKMEIAATDTLVKMERTICYGFCPAYELIIQENGKVTFIGKSHVAHEGRAEGEISDEDLTHLIEAVQKSHFMEMPSSPECESRMTDHPSVFLTIQIDGKRHSINHYHGCKGFEYEEELYDLEEKIDSLAGVDKWVEDQN